MKKIFLVTVILLITISCEFRSGEKILPGSIGRYNELMLVINPSDWDGKIGIALKKVIKREVLGLPQPEPQFTVTHIPHQGFSGFLKHNRNILRIKKAKKGVFTIRHDVFAKQQTFVDIAGPDKQTIIKLIEDNADEIITVFKESDIKQIQKDLLGETHKIKSINTFSKQGFSVKVPLEYSLVNDTGDFVWFRKRIQDYNYGINGSLDIFAYTIPLEVPFEQIKDSIISIRNSIGKKYIRGGREGSYLITEKLYTPHIFDTKIINRNAYKTKGKWEVINVIKAGPFINYTIEDSKNKRLVIIEGLMYLPGVKKRDFMFTQEAIIRTIQIK